MAETVKREKEDSPRIQGLSENKFNGNLRINSSFRRKDWMDIINLFSSLSLF